MHAHMNVYTLCGKINVLEAKAVLYTNLPPPLTNVSVFCLCFPILKRLTGCKCGIPLSMLRISLVDKGTALGL